MKIYSVRFAHQEMIPPKYTCDGEDVSPPLKWENVPSEAKSFALIMDDPDAPMGTWVHWVIFNLPANENHLEENTPKRGDLPNGIQQGKNSSGRIGYSGPCPPSGTHRYFFKFYALDTLLDVPSGITKDRLIKTMQDHIIDQAEMYGRYQRS